MYNFVFVQKALVWQRRLIGGDSDDDDLDDDGNALYNDDSDILDLDYDMDTEDI